MVTRDLLRLRLQIQRLERSRFATPADMVRFFGAVQAQDFFGSLWAVGRRVNGATETSVEAALNDKSIVRSWPMRGTIHYTAPEDLRWMLDLLAPRAIARSATHQRAVNLTEKDFTRARKLFEMEMRGRTLDRNEIYHMLERKNIKTADTRGLHILGQMAREKVICFGPRRGKQPTLVLLDEWIPTSRHLSHDESLAELTLRYFRSHGPATVNDFSWWSGLTVSEAKLGLNIVTSDLTEIRGYWMGNEELKTNNELNVTLLPAYDEFLVGYKERTDMHSIFTPTIIVNGDVAGTWKRTVNSNGVKVTTTPARTLSVRSEAAVRREMKHYARFVGMKLTP